TITSEKCAAIKTGTVAMDTVAIMTVIDRSDCRTVCFASAIRDNTGNTTVAMISAWIAMLQTLTAVPTSKCRNAGPACTMHRVRPPSQRRVRRRCRRASLEHASFATDAGAFLGHRAFHQQHHGHQHERHHGHQPKDIEISQRGCLLLAQILECLPGQL